MAFLRDLQELKTGLVIFRRADVRHRNWYCRVRLPTSDRYKTISLKTSDVETAKERAFDQDSDVRFRLKHEVPLFNRPFSQIARTMRTCKSSDGRLERSQSTAGA